MGDVRQLREKVPDSEKITINPGDVNLEWIDLSVQGASYLNQTELIRTAICNQLVSFGEVFSKNLESHIMELGFRD